MPIYQFLDKIINTVELYVPLTNKYKEEDSSLYSDHDSTLVTNKQIVNNQLATANSSFTNSSRSDLFVSNYIQSIQIQIPYSYAYLNYTYTYYIADSSAPTTEKDLVLSLSFLPPADTSALQGDLFYSSEDFIVELVSSTSAFNKILNPIYSMFSSDFSFIFNKQEAPQAFNKAFAISSFINKVQIEHYVPSLEDTIYVAYDVVNDKIVEYIEPADVEEYTPPDPGQIQIIPLKEFWA